MLSLYIHAPFCVRKCHYCGFYSTAYSRLNADLYLTSLRLEAVGYQQTFSDRLFESVYIGGGTPTVLSSEQLKALIDIVKEQYRLSPDVEWTIEANPNTVSTQKLMLLLDSGINRLSLGVQSFHDEILTILGRPHTSREAADCFRLARKAGFANISLDLIYGIPGQSAAQWKETLDRAVDLEPNHISAYSLSIDEGSRFMSESAAGRLALPDEESVAAMYEHTAKKLTDVGYEHYEISNFCLPGFSCRHNNNYWTRGEYLGLGPGAWSFISGRRYHVIDDIGKYAARMGAGASVIEDQEVVEQREAANETVMLGLRTSRGVDLVRYEKEFGVDALRRFAENAAPLKQAGLLEEHSGRLKLSDHGILLSNEALTRLIR